MKLVIQIPCYNEEATLPLVWEKLPQQIPGIDVIETQIIDDGSTDDTVAVARRLGVTYVVSNLGNQGLGVAFRRGVEHALAVGADIVVNTDGDNQYPSERIGDLCQPIIQGRADVVIGNRQTSKIAHFSPLKKFLQRLGSGVTSFLAGKKMADAVSGFRAYSREACLEINVISKFSYVLDTIIQATKKGLRITYVDIVTNPKTRESRLFKGIWQHIRKSTLNLLRVYSLYEPFRIFLTLGLLFMALALYPIIRFLVFWWQGVGSGHVQSLIFGTIFFVLGSQFIGLGILGEHLAVNRLLTERVLRHQKEEKYRQN